MRTLPLLVLLLAACGSSKTTTQPPAPIGNDAAVATLDAYAGETCVLPDGSVVATFCAPVSRDGDPPMHTRNPDGTCGQCMLRCLPPAAMIATPLGDRAIASLAIGDLVWTVDASGARVAAPIARLRALDAPATHRVLRVTLDDGRVVTASGGHPLADGTELAALAPGATLDGARVVSIADAALDGAATWDLLPDGATGLYWADGVLLGSTLTAPSAPSP